MRKHVYIQVLLVIGWFYLIAPMQVCAATKITCPIEVKENYSKMTEMFKLINDSRSVKGKTEYILDSRLTEYAMQRAAELGVFFSHQRPSCESFDGGKSYGEIIAGGNSNASETLVLWMNSSMHVGSILGDYQYCGVGCVESSTRYGIYWVVLVSNAPLEKMESFPSQGSKNRIRYFDLDVSERLFRIQFTRPNLLIPYGEPSTYHVCMADPYNNTRVNWSYEPPADILAYTVSDPAVFSVDHETGNFLPHKVGKATLTVRFKECPSIFTSMELTVSPPSPNQIKIALENGREYSYTGKEVKPKVHISYKDYVLQEGVDYDLRYKDNIYPGMGTITVYTKGNFDYSWAEDGIADIHFYIIKTAETVTPKPTVTPAPTMRPNPETPIPTVLPTPVPQTPEKTDISKVEAEFISSESTRLQLNYTGKALVPEVFVYKRINSQAFVPLKKGYDYNLIYKDNVVPGNATVIITGIGKYTGIKSLSFTIVSDLKEAALDAPVLFGAVNVEAGIKITWKKVNAADGYYIYRKNLGGKWKKIGVTKKISYTDTSIKNENGTLYIYTVRAYKGNRLSSYYAGKTKVRLNGTKLSTCKSKKKGQVSLTWKKNTKITGYVIQYSLSNTFKNGKMIELKSKSTIKWTLKKLTSKKNYYFRIRTYKTVNGKKYYSAWSPVKKIRIN